MLKKMKIRIMGVFLCAVMVFSGVTPSKAADYSARTSVPANTNSYYYSANNPFYTWNLWTWCTWYAYGRAYEILGSKPDLSTKAASRWFSDNKTKYDSGKGGYAYSTNYYSAKLGAIACYSGHVQVVEAVAANGAPSKISTGGHSGGGGAAFQQPKDKDWTKWRSFRYGQDYDKNTFKGYIYILNGNANPVATQSVKANFYDYAAKQSIGTTNAVLAKTITVENASIKNVSKVGIILYNSNGKQIASKEEKPVPAGNKINAWYDVNSELKCQLTPGAAYQYKFYAVVNGSTYYSTTWSFRTNAAVTVNFSAYANKYSIGQTNAVLSRTITVQNASIKDVSRVGIALYNASWQYIGGKTEKPIPVGNQINAWYNVNSELGVRLNRRTKYYYRFQATLGGTTYYGDWMTFTTK